MVKKRGAAADSVPASSPPVKRAKNYTEEDAKLAEIFDRLSSELESTRLDAASELLLKYGAHKDSDGAIVSRLIRGLCSSRKGARPGFFVALTELLQSWTGASEFDLFASLSALCDRILILTEPSTQASGQEQRDYSIGRLTALSAVVHSSALLRGDSGSKILLKIFEISWEVSQRVPNLTEHCGKVYFDAFVAAIQGGSTRDAESTLEFLNRKNLLRTPEGVATWLEASRAPFHVTYPKAVWHRDNPLSTKETSKLSKILSQAAPKSDPPEGEHLPLAPTGARRDAPHFVWNSILRYFMDNPGNDSKNGEPYNRRLKHFWLECVDNVYFASNASLERKALGFRILVPWLQAAPSWALRVLFSPKLTTCLVNQYGVSERYLHKAVTAIVNQVKQRADADEESAVILVQSFIPLSNGEVDIDTLTKSKSVISAILTSLQNDRSIKGAIEHLGRVFCTPGAKNEQNVESTRRIISELFMQLTRSRERVVDPKVGPIVSWKQRLLLIMCQPASLTYEGLSNGALGEVIPPISPKSKNILVSRFWSCLKDILSSCADGNIAILQVVKSMNEFGMREYTALAEADEDVQMAVKTAQETFSELYETAEIESVGSDSLPNGDHNSNEENLKTKGLRAVLLLLSMTLMQVYFGDLDATGVLEELQQFHEELVHGSSTNEKSSGGTVKKDFDPIVEIILSFCSKPSALYRQLSEQTFSVFASDISSDALRSMVRVLEQGENLAGQKMLFDSQPEDEDLNEFESKSDADQISDSGSASSKRHQNDGLPSPDSSDKAEIDSSRDEDSNGEDVIGGDPDEALNEALGQILKTQQINEDEAANESDSDSSASSMDDEQMEALNIDAQLATIFKQRHQQQDAKGRTKSGGISEKKREQKDAKQNMLNFKNRVLDLLDIYVKKQHASLPALDLVLPLLTVIGATRSPQIAKKTSDLLDQYFKRAKGKGMPLEAVPNIVRGMLEDVHLEALKFASKLHAGAASKCSLFLARLLHAIDSKEAFGFLVELYAKTHRARLEGESKLPAAFWRDWIEWSFTMK